METSLAVQVREIEARTILTPQKWGSLQSHYEFSLNPYAGCAFGCSYCYVPKFPHARHGYNEWGTWVEVKVNAPELIYKERLKVFNNRLFFSSATDPYQYLELKYRLSRRCLTELLKYQPAKIQMHTRSHLILQDLEILKQFGKTLRVGVSITTDDDNVRRQFEPNAPSITRRLQLIQALQQAGIRVHASLSPLLPCNPDRLVALLKPYVDNIWIDQMRNQEVNTKPELIDRYGWFFQAESYRATIEQIAEALPKQRTLPETGQGRRTTAETVCGKSAQGQLKLHFQ